MTYAIVRLTPAQLELLRGEAEQNLHVQGLGHSLGEDWKGCVVALEAASLVHPNGQGRRPMVSDEDLLAAYVRLRTVRGVCTELGYTDQYHVSTRLRLLGVVIRPGRPRKQPP